MQTRKQQRLGVYGGSFDPPTIGALNAYVDELPELYSAGVRAVVSLLNIPPTHKRLNPPASLSFASWFPTVGLHRWNKRRNSPALLTSNGKRNGRLLCIAKRVSAELGLCWPCI